MSYANLTSSVNSESNLLDETNQTTSSSLKCKNSLDVTQSNENKTMLDPSNQHNDLLETTVITLDSNNLNTTTTTNVNNDSSLLSLSQTPLISSQPNDGVESFKNELSKNAIDIINSIIPVSSEANYLDLNSIKYVKDIDLSRHPSLSASNMSAPQLQSLAATPA